MKYSLIRYYEIFQKKLYLCMIWFDMIDEKSNDFENPVKCFTTRFYMSTILFYISYYYMTYIVQQVSMLTIFFLF